MGDLPSSKSVIETMITLQQLAADMITIRRRHPADLERLRTIIDILQPVYRFQTMLVGASLILAIALREMITTYQIGDADFWHEAAAGMIPRQDVEIEQARGAT